MRKYNMLQKIFYWSWIGCGLMLLALMGPLALAADTTVPSVTLDDFKLSVLPGDKCQVKLQFSSALKQGFTSFETHRPERLIFDFKNVINRLQQTKQVLNKAGMNTLTVVEANGRTRAIFDLQQQLEHRVQVDGANINIVFATHTVKNQVYANKGECISLNFQDIKVRAVLQLIAEFTGINIITSDAIRSSITLHLQNIPWQQALDIILKTQGLSKRQIGNVLLIAPAEEIAVLEKQELLVKQQGDYLVPLKSDLIQLNYGKATDIAALFKDKNNSVLSPRGTVNVDIRTNSLWVQDIPIKILELRKLIKKLDIPVRQVLIEARIVNVDCNFARELGIKFGLTPTQHSDESQASSNAVMKDADPLAKLNVSLPAAPVTGSTLPVSLGIALAKVTDNVFLDLELSALESEGGGEIISNPHLITANQQTAYIESGEEIPYQEATASGSTNTAFKKAVLSLKVTPQITPDGKVILDLKLNQDHRGQMTNGVPAIDTKQMETQVLVNNGETIVLGGVYEQTKQNQLTRVPFLGTLPVVGGLFRQTQLIRQRKELLIFVTPKIIKQLPLVG